MENYKYFKNIINNNIFVICNNIYEILDNDQHTTLYPVNLYFIFFLYF